ncbi:protein adenylyltransferase SelO [Gemmobacter serpentinus]|uniref:protein adenylyltransferase SelO n=1 Tax=Gemmobacter serpentinus TaxID=2652247 RepID=UPI00124ED4C1|nr:YdiU family protein [Gemmobacter serpentinus]
MDWRFDNSYARDLPGTYVVQKPEPVPAPTLVKLNTALAAELGLDPAALLPDAAALFSGNALPEGAEPIAQAYAGHQFGGFSPQLGDGRALLLGEVIDIHGQRRDIALKGSGRTPFSRRGDGRAALGPVLREYLMGEAMAALGVPTSRALAAVATGARVQRERGLPGAVLTRVAASHLRIGTFEFFAARGDRAMVQRLADYAMARHYPDLPQGEGRYLAFFDAVTRAQARLIAQWMGLGFIHGVMNTDNMTISGETIDYGPCAFMEAYSPGTVFSSIDHQGRYAYGNQPLILGWNLARLAETLVPLFDADEARAIDLANERLGAIAGIYRAEWVQVMRAKLGLDGAQEGDADLAEGFVAALSGTDWTLGFRRLARATAPADLRGLFKDMAALEAWWPQWQARRALDAPARMQAANPAYIPRNARVEEALAAAEAGDLAPFERLLSVLADPYTDRPGLEAYALPAPESFNDSFRTFCGT